MRSIVLWLLLVALMQQDNGYYRESNDYAYADTDSVFVQGDSLIGVQNEDDFFQFINQNVRVTYGTTLVTSDEAIRNVTRRRTSFIHNAVLIHETDTLQADSLFYDEDSEIGRAIGSVRLSNGEVVTSSSVGIHYVDEKRIEFPEGLVLMDSVTTLSGESGLYWTEDEVADLVGNVQMESDEVRLVSDSLIHHRKYSISLARGSVRYLTTLGGDSIWVSGQRVEYNAKDSLSIVRGNPFFMYIERDSLRIDTLIVRGDVLRMQDQDGASHMQAIGRVRIWNLSMAASADSMIYDQSVDDGYETIQLYGNPYIWTDESQLTGDTVKIVMNNGKIDSLFIRGNSFIAQEDSMTQRISQIKGRNLSSRTQRDSILTYTIGPNAEAVYFYIDENNSPDGAFKVSGDEIRIQFEGDSLRKMVFSTDIQGVRYPESDLPSELGLDGLNWNPALKPTKEDLLGKSLTWIQEWAR